MHWNPSAQIEELAQRKLPSRLGLKKELNTLPTYLQEGEELLNLSSGMYDGAQGLIVLTDRRVIFLSAGMMKARFEDFPYSRISSVQHGGGLLMGQLTIFASGNKAELKSMAKDRAKEIADYIRQVISAPPPPASGAMTTPLGQQGLPNPPAPPSPGPAEADTFDKLRKLAELRDAGVITADDFEQKKQQLLGEI